MNITGICPYETPCGWCTKWDKKCDRKVGCEPKTRSIYSAPCRDCDNYDKNSQECIKCGTANNFQNFRQKRKNNND